MVVGAGTGKQMINVLYFASLKEALGQSSEEINLDASITDVKGLRDWICQRGEPWQSTLGQQQRLLASVNQELARPDAKISDGDEVAFFPPVTGG